MRARAGSRLALWGVLAAICVLATAGASIPHPSLESIDASRSIASEAPASPFRLGTAARPFAWSTAVGDLNADGRPDYAVADRIGRGGAGFEYSVELSISGRASQSITFDSTDSALSISLRDVDHDQDLDVVVSTVLSPSVVRVWLNDGRGAFAETSARTTETAWSAAPSLATGDGPDGTGVADSTRRHADDGLNPALAGAISITPLSLVTARASAVRTDSPGALLQPRAPPAPDTLLL
jgi:hypothetical protein